MKRLFLILMGAIFLASPMYGQSKKELQAQLDTVRFRLYKSNVANYRLRDENRELRARIAAIRKHIIEATQRLPEEVILGDSLPSAASMDTNVSTSSASSTSTSNYSTPRRSSSSYSTSGSTYNGRTIYTGPRGGRYYINSKGNKVYIKH